MATATFRPTCRIDDIGNSKTLQFTTHASARKREGHSVIILGAGKSDFDTPDHIKEAAIGAIRRGETKCTALDGSPEMKRTIRDKFRRKNDLDCTPTGVTAAAGAKQILTTP